MATIYGPEALGGRSYGSYTGTTRADAERLLARIAREVPEARPHLVPCAGDTFGVEVASLAGIRMTLLRGQRDYDDWAAE